MTPQGLQERVDAYAEPFSVADLRRLQDAVDRLLEHENNEWPTREHHFHIQQLEHLRHEIARRIPEPA